ncbi:sugar-binding transcriptional regulator [Mesorhizobium sp. CN2-181]|uniref:sugar-binding transcriptional regulator n=1 Tax=Mesorhizobium yinganensis TaxID=3157707 RepID=UPI0032B8470C
MPIRPADQIIHKAAWLYYSHGMRQDEVARELHISRASVAMYLRKARDTGIVTISTSTQLFADDVLARELEDALKLDAVWVVPDSTHSSDPTADVPLVAATVFLGLIGRGARIGVAWGRTVYTIADQMAHADLQGVTVVQLCGNLGAPYSYRPDECTMEIARRLNAKGLNLYAPLVLSSEELAISLRAEPVIREQLDGIKTCDLALYSIGTIGPDSHIVKCGAVDLDGLHALQAAGAAGVVAGRIIDSQGASLDCAYNRRLISADIDALRAIPKRLVVVQEDNKFEPLKAALAGGLCTHLVLGASMARRLLDYTRATPTKRI